MTFLLGRILNRPRPSCTWDWVWASKQVKHTWLLRRLRSSSRASHMSMACTVRWTTNGTPMASLSVYDTVQLILVSSKNHRTSFSFFFRVEFALNFSRCTRTKHHASLKLCTLMSFCGFGLVFSLLLLQAASSSLLLLGSSSSHGSSFLQMCAHTHLHTHTHTCKLDQAWMMILHSHCNDFEVWIRLRCISRFFFSADYN